MGFNKVHRSLLEIFPQIDARVLRAVAIEHSKDADAAVEAVLVEIIPFLTERSRPNTPWSGSISKGQSSEALLGDVATHQTMDSPSVNAVGSADGQNGHNMSGRNLEADDGHKEPFSDIYHGHLERQSNTVGFTLSEENLENSIETKIDSHAHGENVELDENEGINTYQLEVLGDPETDEIISGLKNPESTFKISLDDSICCQALSTLQDENIVANQNVNLIQDKVDCAQLETTLEIATDEEGNLGKSWADVHNSMVGPSSLTAHDLETSPVENSVQLVVLPDTQGSDLEELDKSLPNSTASNMETTSYIVGTEDESILNASMSQSSQIHIMEVLGETIANANNNKKTLFSGMESVINLMREVELKEQAAEQAKVEAAVGGADILAKLEELKQKLQHMKESNSMHAGEVYGEKAILATELRGLQSRVLSLSDKRDKSLAVLDEMRQTLEVRLAAAENEIKSAKQEKLEKEKAAMKAFTDQELTVEKVVQESKILKQHAEENAKLQEFLVDRGRVVDILQGEIYVICRDVKLLKESFDENVPFSKSLSSSQTSCILASSTSSSRDLNPKDLAPHGADSLVDQSDRNANSCFAERLSEAELTRDDDEALLDDGWELFDDRDVLLE